MKTPSALDVALANLRATEEALAAATDDIEYVRVQLGRQIAVWRDNGVRWTKIKESPTWAAFIRIGGS